MGVITVVYLKVRKLIKQHLQTRPNAEARDVYKFLYQGVFGVGHIISEKAWSILVEEAGRIDLTDHLEDPLLEPVSPDREMVRVNLRQYINKGGDLETLYTVMKKSAEHKGDEGTFLAYWSEFRRMAAENIPGIPLADIEEIDDWIEEEGIVPMHHTEAYREAYYPAYRVVLKSVLMEYIDLCG